MNYRQLQYAVLLSEIGSFSQVAEELDISQPALSKQIISLESELGVKLFDRSSTPITLTPAGEFFIEKAQTLIFEEDVLLKTMARYRTGDHGRLVIGASPYRCLYQMPNVIKALQDAFPELHIILQECNSAALHKGIIDGVYDFAIVNLPIDESRLEAIPLGKDMLTLAVPESMLSLIENKRNDINQAIDLAQCANLPFVVLSPTQELRRQFDKLCSMSGLHPNIKVEVVGIATLWAMVNAGVAAALLPWQFALENEDSKTHLFPLKQEASSRQPAIVLRKGQYVSKYADYAIQLLTKYSPSHDLPPIAP